LLATGATRDLPSLPTRRSSDLAIGMGADDHLPKPFNPQILRARVGASLARKRLHDREQMHARALEREIDIARDIQAGFLPAELPDRKSTRLNSSHVKISYAVFC